MTSALKRIFVLVMALAMLLSCFTACNTSDGNEAETEAATTQEEEKVVYTLTLSADKSVATRGDSVILSAVLKAEGQEDIPSEDTDYIIVNGSEYATVVGNTLKISTSAPDGATVAVQAKEGASYSNTVTIKISVPIKSIVASAATDKPKAGQTVLLSKVVDPSDAIQAIEWKITAGDNIATISGDALTVSQDAEVGTVIKVKAVSGEVESNELTLTVKSTVDEKPATKITIYADAYNVIKGSAITINSTIVPSDSTDDMTLLITDGADYASTVGNVLVVSHDAPTGTVIKVVAKAGNANSEEISFTVVAENKPATAVEISADNLNPIAGHSVEIKTTITPSDTTDPINFEITRGSEYAYMAGNFLVLNHDAPKDAVIKVKVTVGKIESDELEFIAKPATEEIKVKTIQISAATANVLKGQAVVITKDVDPIDANQEISLQFVEGAEYAHFNGDTLVISSEAEPGTKISVKAVAGDKESNILTFEVQRSQEEINASKFYIDLNHDIFTLDKKSTTASPVLEATVYNYNYQEINDKTLEFTVIEGNDLLGITPGADGFNCSFTDLKGHGTATVEVRIKGTDVVETAKVNVIVPPESVILPEVFLERTDIEYAFSMIDHEYTYSRRTDADGNLTVDGENGKVYTKATEVGTATLPFVPTVRGDGKVCQDLSFNFSHESGKTGDEVAVYENGAITFKMTGKVTVTVTSASGSKVEATTSYVFNINQGFNVNDFSELSMLTASKEYQGQPINLVVLKKPVGTICTVENCYCGNKEHTYGYDLVPPTALKNHKDQTIYEIITGHPYGEANGLNNNRIVCENRNFYLNGNSHVIDVSQIRIFKESEYNDAKNEYGFDGNPNIGSLLTAEPWGWDGPGGASDNKTYKVNLYNIEVKGNAPIDYDPTKWRSSDSEMFAGIFQSGINIGSARYNCHYYIDANNLTSSSFSTGLSFTQVVGNGKVSNITAYNCFANGILARGSIMTLENITFGPCGATGIELAPELSGKAGLNDNEKQQVTISGTINATTNLNAGNTTYYKNYKLSGMPVSSVINSVSTGIITEAKNNDPYDGENAGWNVVRHIQNTDQEFIFVSLQFHDAAGGNMNYGKVLYPNYQEGGIITMEQLMRDVLQNSTRDPNTGKITEMYVDKTHQFIEMPIVVDGQNAGTALFYNHNYGK